MPFTADSTPEREVRSGFGYFIATGYRDKPLTGCVCTGSTSSTLTVYGDYCEGDCLAARESVSERIDKSPLSPVYRSAIWQKLGPLAHHVYGQLLLLTIDHSDRPIPASASWLAMSRLHGRHDRRAVSRSLRSLERLGLVTSGTSQATRHHRQLVPLTPDLVAALEDQLGVTRHPRHSAGTPTSIDVAHVVTASAYRIVAHSSIWTPAAADRSSRGLGPLAREAFYQLAALAAESAKTRRPITLTASDLAARLDYTITTRTANQLLRDLQTAGVIRRTGQRILTRKLTAAQVAQLEQRLGTARIVAENLATIRRDQLARVDEQNEWTDAEQLINGTDWASRRRQPSAAEEQLGAQHPKRPGESLGDRSRRILRDQEREQLAAEAVEDAAILLQLARIGGTPSSVEAAEDVYALAQLNRVAA